MKPCQERQALWDRYIADLRAYGVAVAKMESAFYLSDFFQAFAKAEERREVFLDARAALDEHTAGHGCNVTDDAVIGKSNLPRKKRFDAVAPQAEKRVQTRGGKNIASTGTRAAIQLAAVSRRRRRKKRSSPR